MRYLSWTVFLLAILATESFGQIPKPDDAPQPLAPLDEAKSFKLPTGAEKEGQKRGQVHLIDDSA